MRRYDGLYKVVKHWEEVGLAGFLVGHSSYRAHSPQVMKYALVRLEGQKDICLNIRTAEDVDS